MGALLAHVGGREVDGDAPEGELEACILDAGADAFAGFLDGRVGQADDVEGRQATADVDLDIEGDALNAEECAGTDARERHGVGSFAIAW